jgi:hypothetical protein
MARIPARTLADIQLGDESFKADFEITDKYQAFSAELLRLSLLGIAGYGFLLSHVAMKDAGPSAFFSALSNLAPVLGVGVSCLGLAAGTALAHRFFSTDCLSHQITILRLLKRTESSNWTEEEKAEDRKRLERERSDQLKDLKRCKYLLIASGLLLLVGAIAGRVYICCYTLRRA